MRKLVLIAALALAACDTPWQTVGAIVSIIGIPGLESEGPSPEHLEYQRRRTECVKENSYRFSLMADPRALTNYCERVAKGGN